MKSFSSRKVASESICISLLKKSFSSESINKRYTIGRTVVVRLFLLSSRDEVEIELIELLLIDQRRSVDHHVTSSIIFGEGDAVSDAIQPCEERDEAVKTISQAPVRRSPVLEGIHQEAELLLSSLRGEA